MIEGNEGFCAKRNSFISYIVFKNFLENSVWLFIFSHSKEWADAEFQERISPNDINPGEAWKLRKDLWEQFLDEKGMLMPLLMREWVKY